MTLPSASAPNGSIPPPPPVGEGRLARRKARTRAAIVAAASALLHEQGYEHTSMQQIAERADAGVGTLYGYFRSKDEVLREVLQDHANSAIERYRAAVDARTPPIDRLCVALNTMADYITENRVILLAAFRWNARTMQPVEHPASWLHGTFSQMLAAGIESGHFRPLPVDVTARMLLSTYSLAMLGIGPWHGLEDDPATLAQLEAMTRALLDAGR
ncbi:MAG: TetR/AcrR family transcriptional regulator [Tepidiformaceae bacterium]